MKRLALFVFALILAGCTSPEEDPDLLTGFPDNDQSPSEEIIQFNRTKECEEILQSELGEGFNVLHRGDWDGYAVSFVDEDALLEDLILIEGGALPLSQWNDFVEQVAIVSELLSTEIGRPTSVFITQPGDPNSFVLHVSDGEVVYNLFGQD